LFFFTHEDFGDGMANSYFTGWTLDRAQREKLLREIPPAYRDVIADHVTLLGRAPASAPQPEPVEAEIIGAVDDGEGVQALIVEVNGSSKRPDGGTFHITWSLDRRRGRKPVQSNEVIARHPWTDVPRRSLTMTPTKRPH
jgi:hypothetical protein